MPLRKYATAIMALLTFLALTGTTAMPVAGVTSPTLVQTASSGTTSSSATLTFSSHVTAGDVVVVCAGITSTASVGFTTHVKDTLKTNYVAQAKINKAQGGGSSARLWYGIAQSSGTDTVTVTVSATSGNPTINTALYGYEIAGSAAHVTSSQSSGKIGATRSQVSPFSPPQGSIVVACGGFPGSGGASAVEAGYVTDHSYAWSAGAHLVGAPSGLSTTSEFVFNNPSTGHPTEVAARIS